MPKLPKAVVREEDDKVDIVSKYSRFLQVNKDYKKRTVDTYTKRIKTFNTWLQGKHIEPGDCRRFLAEKSATSPSNYNLYLQAFQNFSQFCKAEYGFECSLAEVCYKKRRKKRIDVLSTSELEALLAVDLPYRNLGGMSGREVNERYKAVLKFLVFTGSRIGEALSVKVQDCDFSAGKVWLLDTKNGTDRLCMIQEPFLGQLKGLCEGKRSDDYLFTNAYGRPISVKRFRPDLKRRAEAAGITKNVYPHLLRHSFATALLNEHVAIEDIAKLLGHKDIRTTYENYLHFADDHLKAAISRLPVLRKNMSGKDQLKTVSEFVNQIREIEYDKLNYKITHNSKYIVFRAEIKPEFY